MVSGTTNCYPDEVGNFNSIKVLSGVVALAKVIKTLGNLYVAARQGLIRQTSVNPRVGRPSRELTDSPGQ